MKKILSLFLILGSAAVASAQGSFNGNTSTADPGDGSAGTIYDSTIADNSTFTHYGYADGGAGNVYQAEYYIGAQTTDASTLIPIGVKGSVSGGALAGYYQPGQITTPNQFSPSQTVTVQLRAWKGVSGSTYENATLSGVSGLVNVTLSSALGTGPQFGPGQLSNVILAPTPEPATIALGLMGAGALFIRRRKV